MDDAQPRTPPVDPTYVTISREVEWDAGHRIPDHTSKCRHPHGHRYKLQVTVRGQVQPEEGQSEGGMIVDFSTLSALLREVHDLFDHGMMLWEKDASMIRAMDMLCRADGVGYRVITLPFAPTAERLAQWIWSVLSRRISEMNVDYRLVRVTLWETPRSRADVVGGPPPEGV